MLKVTLGPLESAVAVQIAERRGITAKEFVRALIFEEAAIELTHWREPLSPSESTVLKSARDKAGD